MAAEVASASVVVMTCGGSGRRCDAVSLRGLAARYVGEVSAEDSCLVVGEFDQQLANGDLSVFGELVAEDLVNHAAGP